MSLSINVTSAPAGPDDPLVFEILASGSIDGVTANVTDPGGTVHSVYDNGDVDGYTSDSEAITGGLRITVRRLFGWWLGGLSVQVHAGASGSSKLLPNVADTEAHFELQGELTDSSDVGLAALTVLDTYSSLPGGTEDYDTLDDCLQGFSFDGNTKLIAPASAGLRLAGDWTVQFMMLQGAGGVNECYFSSVDPAGRSGGAAPDRIGSLATFYWDHGGAGHRPTITDQGHGSSIGGNNQWDVGGDSGWEDAPHAIAVVCRSGQYELWIDGVQQPTVDGNPIYATAVAAGTERFYIGGCEGPGQSPINTIAADYRVLSVARSGADIYADAQISLASCSSQSATTTSSFTVAAPSGALVTQARSRVILQYQNSPKLLKEIELHAMIGQQVMDFFATLPPLDDPANASGVNLDVDGEIVGQGRLLSDGTIATDGQYRVLIAMKGARNVARVSSADYLAGLVALFGAPVRLADHGGMAISYVVMREPTADEVSVLDADIVPRPMGVKVTRAWAPAIYFGFAEDPGASGFDVGHLVEGF